MSSDDKGWGAPQTIVALLALGVAGLALVYQIRGQEDQRRRDEQERDDRLARDAREAEERKQARLETPKAEPPPVSLPYVAPSPDPSWQYASNDIGGTTLPPPPLNQRFVEPPATRRPTVDVQDRREPSGPMADPYIPPPVVKPRTNMSWPTNSPPDWNPAASGDVVVYLDEWRREHGRGRPSECKNGFFLYRHKKDPTIKKCLPASQG